MDDQVPIQTEFPTSLVSRLGERLGPTARRARDEGIFQFVSAALFAVVFIVSLRVRTVFEEVESRRDQQLFSETFGAKQEERELPYPGVVAGVLGSVNSRRDLLDCKGQSSIPACQAKRTLLDTVSQLFDWAANSPDTDFKPTGQAGLCGSWLRPEQEERLFELWPNRIDKEKRCGLVKAAAAAVKNVRDDLNAPLKTDLPVDCARLHPETKPSTFGVGVAGCDHNTTLAGAETLIPAQESSADIRAIVQRNFGTDVTKTTPLKSPSWSGNSLDSLSFARLLDPSIMAAKVALESHESSLLGAVPKAQATTGEGEGQKKGGSPPMLQGSELRQAYFISPHNTLRLWNAAGGGLTGLPRGKLWSNASYFRQFVSEGRTGETETAAYLDFAGHGLVTTECRPLWIGPPATGALAGAVCVDLSLDIFDNAGLWSEISRNRFLHFQKVLISRSVNDPMIRMVDEPESSLDISSEGVTAAIREVIAKTTLEKLAQMVQPIDVEHNHIFLVPVGDAPSGELQALLVYPQERSTPKDVAVATTSLIVSVVAFSLSLFWGLTSRQKENARRADRVIFRSLQIGVTEVEPESNQILRANDRAEELIGRALPKDRNRRSPQPTFFNDIYDVAFEIENDKWPDVDDAPHPPEDNYIPMDEAVLLARRSSGRTTRYWIHLKDGRDEIASWLRVQAGPLFQESNSFLERLRSVMFGDGNRVINRSNLGTFGTLERVGKVRFTKLRDARTKYSNASLKKSDKQ